MPEKKPISVFGATGFIGSRFCRLADLHCIPVPRESRIPQTPENVYFISTTHNYHVFEDVHQDVHTNLTVLLDVLKNLRPGESVFNFISSWFVYGETELPAHEQSICNPRGFYSITKRTAEMLLESYCRTFKINYRILRLGNIYGPGDRDVGKKKNALQYLINRMAHDEPIGLYDDGRFYRDYMYVDDAVAAIGTCIKEAPVNSIINIGSGHRTLFRDVIMQARQTLGSQSEITSMEPPEFHQIVQVKDFYMNVDKLRSLGFTPKVSIPEGIEILCQTSKTTSGNSFPQ